MVEEKENNKHICPMCKFGFYDDINPLEICGNQSTSLCGFCQLPEGHIGRHQAIIFWE